ncbi:plasmid replication protein RepC [Adhaeretor mobilis]|uniref:Plasmid replication protein C N-terminal domain-containing protein n=1 Tax=Adhaeretor mobilis TaxID=1930276 RepID=A0A517MWR3_9BACT|nr:plasmid replication protein RepC [Adhaeretor mobilis]QDS99320.1 hypothetical protein HG15A2_26420 [Adhaeretor mobilis]
MQETTVNQYPQGGGRVASDQYRHSQEQCLDFTGLDQTVDRYQLLLLVKRVGKLAGFTPRMIQLLDYYMAYTTQADWEEGSRPIVFQSLSRTAMDLGVGERQIQKLEKQLFELGAISWNDSGNHKRFGHRDPKTGRLLFAYGVDLAPLAYLKEELEAKLQEKQLYAEAWRATKREISECRRQVRSLLLEWREEGADPAQLEGYESAYREIAFELRSHIDLSRLRTLSKRHTALTKAIRESMGVGATPQKEQPTTSFPIAPTTPKRPCRHAQKVAHSEHTNPVKKRREREPFFHPESSCQSPRSEASLAIGTITIHQLVRSASERFREHLPYSSKRLAWSDVIEAAYRRRAELHISKQSWAEACGALGRVGAAVGLVLTDRAACRVNNPVKHATAYFRRVCNGMDQSCTRHSP